VERGVGYADEELGDLHGGQGALDAVRDPDGEGGYGVVCVLGIVSQLNMVRQ
jgi:hypothetical protein